MGVGGKGMKVRGEKNNTPTDKKEKKTFSRACSCLRFALPLSGMRHKPSQTHREFAPTAKDAAATRRLKPCCHNDTLSVLAVWLVVHLQRKVRAWSDQVLESSCTQNSETPALEIVFSRSCARRWREE